MICQVLLDVLLDETLLLDWWQVGLDACECIRKFSEHEQQIFWQDSLETSLILDREWGNLTIIIITKVI